MSQTQTLVSRTKTFDTYSHCASMYDNDELLPRVHRAAIPKGHLAVRVPRQQEERVLRADRRQHRLRAALYRPARAGRRAIAHRGRKHRVQHKKLTCGVLLELQAVPDGHEGRGRRPSRKNGPRETEDGGRQPETAEREERAVDNVLRVSRRAATFRGSVGGHRVHRSPPGGRGGPSAGCVVPERIAHVFSKTCAHAPSIGPKHATGGLLRW